MKNTLKKYDYIIHEFQFVPILAAFERKSEIVLWKTLKANGENCSISWVEKI